MEVLLVAGGKHGSISRMPNAFPLVSISFFFLLDGQTGISVWKLQTWKKNPGMNQIWS